MRSVVALLLIGVVTVGATSALLRIGAEEEGDLSLPTPPTLAVSPPGTASTTAGERAAGSIDGTGRGSVGGADLDAVSGPAAEAGEPTATATYAADHFHDEILETPMLGHPDFVAEVRRWVHFWETAPREWFPDYLDRMTWFEEIVDTTLAAHGLPWSLRYLPVIESGYSPTAVSRAEAVGMWQFMSHTAGDFDIEVGPLVDDRRDPYVSTAAAATYLAELRERFGSWFLALAAYNAGPDRIQGILDRRVPDAEPSDAVYWAIRPFLPKETADFVPTFFGAMIVASDPESHGYLRPEPSPFVFDEIQVRGRLTFEDAAAATGTTVAEIARLNPEYLRQTTPTDRVMTVRIPVGSGDAFRAYFEERAARPDG